jgi:hypothetical protein
MDLDKANHEDFRRLFSKLDIEALKDIQRILTRAIDNELEFPLHSISPFNNQSPQGTGEGESTMNTSIQAVANQRPYSVESDRIDHFIKVRLPRMAMVKTHELEQHFGMVDDPSPRTFKELMERIEKKHYVIDEKTEEDKELNPFSWGCPLDSIRFRDPKKVEDRKGYTEAVKAMHEGMRATEDEIVAYQNDGEKVLAALAKFEANTYH